MPEKVPDVAGELGAGNPGTSPGTGIVPADGNPEPATVAVAEVVHLCTRCRRELTRRKRRRAAPRRLHPGVVIMSPDDHGHGYRVRYFDPNLKRTVKVAIEPDAARDEASRVRFAQKLSLTIQTIKSEHKASLGRLSQVASITLEAGAQAFWDANPGLAANTRSTYTRAHTFLTDGRATMLTRDVSLDLIDSTRSVMVNLRDSDGEPLAEITINSKYIKPVRQLLIYWRVTGRMHPDIHTDQIEAALKLLRVVHERKVFLTPTEISQLLEACQRYDADHPVEPFGPLVRCWLLTGLRHGELLRVERPWISREHDLDRIALAAHATKTRILRSVDLSVAPSALPADLDPSQPGLVFGGWTPDRVYAARDITVSQYGAPEWSPQLLRRTCASYFTCAFGAARSARSLGHTIDVADKHYVGAVAIPHGATTLEQAMRLEPVLVSDKS